MRRWSAAVVLLSLAVFGCGSRDDVGSIPVRVGYFPNITHSQAVIGLASENGSFQKALGPGVKIVPRVFNAGPSVIEALFAGELDLSYIGPNPAINGYVKSKGSALRIIAGATSGGAVLVVRKDAQIRKPADFAGRRIASPQLGNTQDVALRYYLMNQGLATEERGGTVAVIPAQNPDILTLFLKKEIDGAWVPEPWGARLIREGDGVLFADERDLWQDRKFTTAVVIVNTAFLKAHPDLVKRWLEAHVELTEWIVEHPQEAQQVANREIARLSGKGLPAEVLSDAWSRMDVTYDPIAASLLLSADRAFALGFLGKEKPTLSQICDLDPLNQVLRVKRLPEIPNANILASKP